MKNKLTTLMNFPQRSRKSPLFYFSLYFTKLKQTKKTHFCESSIAKIFFFSIEIFLFLEPFHLSGFSHFCGICSKLEFSFSLQIGLFIGVAKNV